MTFTILKGVTAFQKVIITLQILFAQSLFTDHGSDEMTNGNSIEYISKYRG